MPDYPNILDKSKLDYSTIYIAPEMGGPKSIALPVSADPTLDPLGGNSIYVQALNIYQSYFHYGNSFTPLPNGTIQLNQATTNVRMSFFVNAWFDSNNPVIGVALGAYIPAPVSIQAYAPNWIANTFQQAGKLATFSVYAPFPPPATLPGIIYSLWFASSLAGTLTIQSSIFSLEAVN